MTINEIMLRDIFDAEKEEREAERKGAERGANGFAGGAEIVGGILTLALFILLAWLFLIATPDQYSAECELLRAEMEAQGK